ncbi:ankyrin repeat and KH domain-containing protein mask [Colletotrichum spaethianum]|uniref:Ankyrin repeat and KH domain-containing protein mask n=1 Tax=Colletotrichum spaethianum TaxID=700344 RepID=A0AA37NZI1_9PEZI|nr:ankyrin repeat and KH domain-containing protein mask [Colletotrichum spaethianum]GKT44465.1 ankyrin repeat and KH domain-containing protein mask [Colletotrichum spaethianum]
MTILEAFSYCKYRYRNWPKDSQDNVVSEFRGWLALGAPINRPNGGHGIVLHLLIRNGLDSVVECLEIALQAGARIEDRDEFSCGRKTPLQVAAEVGNLEAVRLLLGHGADINALPGSEFGRTALQAAVYGSNYENIPAIVELLLSFGADVNVSPAEKGGITALQGAAISGNITIAKTLLDQGANVNAGPAVEEGRTAIEGAAEHGRLDMVRFLISVGATGDPAKGFERAIELAEKEHHFMIADFLRDYQDMSAGFGVGTDDVSNDEFFSEAPAQGFVFSDEALENFPF